MALVCPRCRRANPAEAVYCHFDGAILDAAAGAEGVAGRLPHEFVFPSGRRCKTYDDLVQGCQSEWEEARDLLKQGDFARFLARGGRLDLARAARDAQGQSDPDVGLHDFVGSLPASQVAGPRLDLIPRRLQIGPLRGSRRQRVKFAVVNQGKGLLQGKLSVTEGAMWLRVAGGTDAAQLPLKAAREQEVELVVDAGGLAAPERYSGRLTVITNGGVAEVPVRLELEVAPFDRAPFNGIVSARELAERMRADPKAAAPVLESGRVREWFTANGWTYPVPGPTAPAVAAVQQFFEYMRLSKPPVVALDEEVVSLTCTAPERALGSLLLRTDARKWVYAQAESDAPWLRPLVPMVSGPREAALDFEVDSSLLDAGRSYDANLTILANAGQKLTARVRVNVERAGRKPRRSPARSGNNSKILAGVMAAASAGFLYRLLLAAPADLYGRGLASTALSSAAVAGLLEPSAVQEILFVRRFVIATWWLGAIAGLVLVRRQGGRLGDYLFGATAGAAAGVVGAATLGCALGLLDAPARAILRPVVQQSGGAVPAPVVAILWVTATALGWGLLGAVFGLVLPWLGGVGRKLLSIWSTPTAFLLRSRS